MTREELESEVERLRVMNADLRLMVDGLEKAAHEERAAVVAWLRSESFVMEFRSKRNLGRRLADVAADTIERGEHRREEER